VKPAVIALLLVSALISVLTVLMIIWIAPVVGVHDSACERYPLSAGCRLLAAPDHESRPRWKDNNAKP
jgi:hypothetical protein